MFRRDALRKIRYNLAIRPNLSSDFLKLFCVQFPHIFFSRWSDCGIELNLIGANSSDSSTDFSDLLRTGIYRLDKKYLKPNLPGILLAKLHTFRKSAFQC